MSRVNDLTGKRFGKLTVLCRSEENSKAGKARWVCLCDCGEKTVVTGGNLIQGKQVSCKCNRNEKSRNQKGKHITHGESKSRLYPIWMSFKARCDNPNNTSYPNYGARGITYCEEWKKYENFAKWARESGYDDTVKRGKCTLDRIDVNGNYCPSNCRWVNQKIQGNNTRVNHLVTANGETHTLSEWSEITGIDKTVLRRRDLKGKRDADFLKPTPRAEARRRINELEGLVEPKPTR